MLDFAKARRTMVDSQLRTFDVTDRALLVAMGEVERERYVPSGREALAYMDRNVPMAGSQEGGGRVMLAPMVLARLIQALEINADARVLDVASNLGYSSAVLARLGASVVSLESDDAMAAASRTRLAEDGVDVVVRTAALLDGAPDSAPFDAILVQGALDMRPQTLLSQLKNGGRLACLSRGEGACKAVVYVRSGDAYGVRALFEATAPGLAEATPAPAFVF